MPSLPMPYHTEPPCSASRLWVVMLIVPPIEGAERTAAPRPRCVWMFEATSPRPAQLLQYTQPPSMSLTGIPFTSTATFALWKPRMLILASPKPPPSFVAHTPGVVLRISGSSWVPSLRSISALLTCDTATGVWRVRARDCVTTTSLRISFEGSRVTVPTLALTETDVLLKPT